MYFVGKLTQEENIDDDKVDLSTLRSYLQAGGGACVTALVLLFILISIAIQTFSSYWLSLWLKDGSGVSNKYMTLHKNLTTKL